jgi:ankyrin repeat protein
LNDYDSVKFLLENGANPNTQDKYGRTPVSMSMYYGGNGIICILNIYGGNYEKYFIIEN